MNQARTKAFPPETTDQLSDTQASAIRLARSERLQQALFAISALADSNHDLRDILRGIHGTLGQLIYADKLYVVRCDAEHNDLRLVYAAESADSELPGGAAECPLSSLEQSLTRYLLRAAKPFRGNVEDLRAHVS